MTEHKDQETATADSERERDGLPGGEAGPGSGGEDQQDVAGAGGSPDSGDPGGMGGARAHAGNPHQRPPGGMSPIEPEEERQD